MLILRSVGTGLKTLRSNLSPGQSARHFFGGSRKGQNTDEVLRQFRHFNRQLLLGATLSYLGVFIAYAAVPGLLLIFAFRMEGLGMLHYNNL